MGKEIDSNEMNLMLTVIKCYYEMGMNQEQIAKKEFISKSSVSRLIKKAIEHGYVTFQINYPVESIKILEEEFHRYFDVDKVFITPSYTEDHDIRLRYTCNSASADLYKIIKDGDIISVSWGTTMDQLASLLKPNANTKKNLKVVLMNGSIGGNISSTKSSQIVEKFAEVFNAEGYLLPAPLIVDKKEIAQTIINDSHVGYVMELAKKSELSVVSIGALTTDSVLTRRGAYSKVDYNEVLQLGAVGDIAGRCFDINGEKVSEQVNERTIGLTLEDIKSKPVRIGIGVGRKKARAIIGALRGKIINRIFTDEITAKEVIMTLKNTLNK
jgi:deoxyribonucleoside regulator